MSSEPLSEDLGATVAARKELGDEYEAALVQSFLAKVDREVDARVTQRLDEVEPRRPRRASRPADGRRGATFVALGSITLGIPVSAIVIQMHGAYGFFGVLISWAAITAVNIAHAIGRQH